MPSKSSSTAFLSVHSQLSLAHQGILILSPKYICPLLAPSWHLVNQQIVFSKGPHCSKFSKNNGLEHVPCRCWCKFIPPDSKLDALSVDKRMNTGYDYFLKTSLSRLFLLSPYLSLTSSCHYCSTLEYRVTFSGLDLCQILCKQGKGLGTQRGKIQT